MTQFGVLSFVLFLTALAWVVLRVVPKALSKSTVRIPATVPSERVEEYRRNG